MEWVDFRLLKQTVSIAEVLEHYRIVLKPSGPDALRGACPLPTHSSDSSEMSFMADRRKNVWACHSQSCIAARRGAIGGNILDFVCVMEACSAANRRVADSAMVTPGATRSAECTIRVRSLSGGRTRNLRSG